MAKVGPKGQVIIDRRIRERLGIRPGMLTVQAIVGDHVELRFLPAEHDRSLAGAARTQQDATLYPFDRRFPDLGIRRQVV